MINARRLIIELKNFTIQTSTKQNSAHHTSMVQTNVSMETIAHLLILMLRSLSNLLTNLRKILTSICFISKLCGVHIMKQDISEMFVFMLIIGKTIEENLNSTSTLKINVRIGNQDSICSATKMDAQTSINVNKVMVGRNKNTILKIIR